MHRGVEPLELQLLCSLLPQSPPQSHPRRAPTMAGIVKYVERAFGKPSLLEAVKAGGWRCLINGSLTYVHRPAGLLAAACLPPRDLHATSL